MLCRFEAGTRICPKWPPRRKVHGQKRFAGGQPFSDGTTCCGVDGLETCTWSKGRNTTVSESRGGGDPLGYRRSAMLARRVALVARQAKYSTVRPCPPGCIDASVVWGRVPHNPHHLVKAQPSGRTGGCALPGRLFNTPPYWFLAASLPHECPSVVQPPHAGRWPNSAHMGTAPKAGAHGVLGFHQLAYA